MHRNNFGMNKAIEGASAQCVSYTLRDTAPIAYIQP